jgi:predicted AAA+ superfamily ATPase
MVNGSEPRIPLDDPRIKTIVDNIKEDAECLLRGEPERALQKASQVITRLAVSGKPGAFTLEDKALFLLSCNHSVKRIPGYATLNSKHIQEVEEFSEKVERYINDASLKRPLNFLMSAAPGAGKSHFIKCIARSLESNNVRAVTFNMAGLQRHEDLIPPLDEARNLKVDDRVPLLFLDEFDADEDHFALLLPLLWDSELNLGQRDLKLGKLIIVLAGSRPSLKSTMDQARSMKPDVRAGEGNSSKLVDLLSRINGGAIEIPSFEERDYDKVCIAVELLRQRFRALKQVPVAILRFLAKTEFRYGSRSISAFINTLPNTKGDSMELGNMKSSALSDPKMLKKDPLAYHLVHAEDQAHGICQAWTAQAMDDSKLPIRADKLKYLQSSDSPRSLLGLHLGYLVDELSKMEAPLPAT